MVPVRKKEQQIRHLPIFGRCRKVVMGKARPGLPLAACHHRFIGMVDHAGQLPRRETRQIDGVPVGLLHRRAVAAPDHDAGQGQAECLAGEGGTFEGDLVRIDLGEDSSRDLVTDGPRPEGTVFVSTGLVKAEQAQLIRFHRYKPPPGPWASPSPHDRLQWTSHKE